MAYLKNEQHRQAQSGQAASASLHLHSLRLIVILLAFASFCVLLGFITSRLYYERFAGEHTGLSRWKREDYKQKGKDHPLFDEPTQGGPHFIFLETTCFRKNTHSPPGSSSGLRMTPRAACAMTAAARLHPERLVYYLHTCRINRTALAHKQAPPFALSVLANPNFRLWDLRFKDAFIGTPLHKWSKTDALHRSSYPQYHASDALRFVSLWKYGGTYLDTDVLMLRSLGEMRDFTSNESPYEISVGATDMSLSATGRNVAWMCVQDMLQNFHPRDWINNGPRVLRRVLRRLCDTMEISNMTPQRCRGFNVLPTSAFYPIHWMQWHKMFQEEGAESTMKIINNSFGVHMWNSISQKATVFTNSSQPYAQLARRLCPSVVYAVNGIM